MQTLHTDRLRAFLAVARTGGFTRGAAQLGRTQSSVSQAVRLLEDELGVQLFVREPRNVHLTDAGALLLGHAERAFEELDRAREALAALADLSAGRLVCGSTDTLAVHVLPPLFAAFRERHPGVELELVNRPSPALATQVADRDIDLALVTLPLPERAARRTRVEPLVPHRDVLITPPGHPLARFSEASLADVARHALLLLDKGTGTRALLDAHFEALGATPEIVMEMSSVEVLKRLVELGFGASIVPALAAHREVSAGTLVTVPLVGLPARHVGLVTPSAGLSSHASRAFAALARTVLRSPAAPP